MFLKLIPYLLDIQKKLYAFIYGRKYTDIIDNSSRTTKTFMTKNETVILSAKTRQKSAETSLLAKEILKKHLNEPKKLFEFIESKGTKVIVAKNMEKVLLLIKEEEGFITPLKGIKALYLSIMINLLAPGAVSIGLKTPEMFVMRSYDINVYSLIHQFHHWLSFKKRLPGYEEATMNIFKNIWRIDATQGGIEALSVNEILSLKDAIDRDKEAIDFVKAFTREQMGSKNSLNLLKEGKKVNI